MISNVLNASTLVPAAAVTAWSRSMIEYGVRGAKFDEALEKDPCMVGAGSVACPMLNQKIGMRERTNITGWNSIETSVMSLRRESFRALLVVICRDLRTVEVDKRSLSTMAGRGRMKQQRNNSVTPVTIRDGKSARKSRLKAGRPAVHLPG